MVTSILEGTQLQLPAENRGRSDKRPEQGRAYHARSLRPAACGRLRWLRGERSRRRLRLELRRLSLTDVALELYNTALNLSVTPLACARVAPAG